MIIKSDQLDLKWFIWFSVTDMSRNISISNWKSAQCIVGSKRSHVNDVMRNETERTRSQRHEQRGKRDKW